MCGILGWVTPQAKEQLERFGAALDTLAHRGPDDQGVFCDGALLLGHRRLSIIDLSDAGHQPMRDPESGAVIVFNGEIYNYLELRVELVSLGHVFRTESDTEVLLHAYLEWGTAALGRLNGMWAFAIWQPEKRCLFVARDRFGVKPFYFMRGTDGFTFASEPKALLALFPYLRQPDEMAVYKFLAEGMLYSDNRSFYQGINILPPAHYAEYQADSHRFAQFRYWDYPEMSSDTHSDADSVDEFTSLFEDAVRLRTRSDVPVGVTLSGGLDSTAVLAAAMRQTGGKRVCFTSVYGGNDRGEAGWAGVATEPYGMVPVEVEAPQSGWIETLGRIAWHMDGPGYSPAVYPLWHLMQQARQQGVYVLMEGQGADEALGGYPQYAVIDMVQKIKGVRTPAGLVGIKNSWQRLCGTFTTRWAVLWMLREMFPALVALNRRYSGAYSTLSSDYLRRVERDIGRKAIVHQSAFSYGPVTTRLQADHAQNILPGLLHYGDAMSMAHGVETRLPFMDYRLVEWLFRQPETVKIHNGSTKWVLREYLQGVDQGRIAARKDKLGYPTPVERWLSEHQGDVTKSLLLSSDAHIYRFCDPLKIKRLLDYHQAGVAGAGHHVYRLVSTELWMRQCL